MNVVEIAKPTPLEMQSLIPPDVYVLTNKGLNDLQTKPEEGLKQPVSTKTKLAKLKFASLAAAGTFDNQTSSYSTRKKYGKDRGRIAGIVGNLIKETRK